MNSSSSTVLDLRHDKLCEYLTSMKRRRIVLIVTIEKRKNEPENSYSIHIHYRLKEKRK